MIETANDSKIRSVKEFFDGAQVSIQKFNQFIRGDGARNLSEMRAMVRADHISYKCDSQELFEQIRKFFEFNGNSSWIQQEIISKRRIALIQTNVYLQTEIGAIRLLELSDQKPDMSQKKGFDHIEVYPIMDLKTVMDHFMQKLGAVREVRPHHTTYDISIDDEFKVRLSETSMMEKITKEMKRN